jgi:SAM-dependent methyltransferase
MFDFVISFQVIEHIKDDQLFISEAHRVLKKGGKLLLSTPNKLTSLTRNPFHVREYTAAELYSRAQTCFSSPQIMGLHPSEGLKGYLASHKMQVDKILKWDILKLEKRLPRMLLKIPYNLFNQLNKAMVFQKNPEKLNEIGQADFILGDPTAESLDFFVVAEK